MSSENTEWPTSDDIRALRSRGIFAYSSFVTRGVILSIFLITCFLLSARFSELSNKISIFLSADTISLEQIQPIIDQVFFIVIVCSLVVLVCGVCVVLLQSRFYFSFTNVSFSLQRLKPFRGYTFSRIIFILFAGLLGVISGCALSAFFLWISFRDTFYLLVFEKEKFYVFPTNLMNNVVPLILVVLLVSCFLAFFYCRYTFMYRNKVSKRQTTGQEANVDKVYL